MFHWLLTLSRVLCWRSYRWHFCMLVQGHYIDNVNFGIRHCFQFDLSLTFDPLSVGRTKRSPWTLLRLRPRLTHWPFYFCHLTHFVIWPFLTFDPLSVGRTKRSPWTLLHLRPRLTHWPFYFCHLTHFVIWPFFDLWPLNRRSDKEVTVDTYACLPNTDTLTLLLLSFDTFCNLTFLWHLTP